MMTKQSMKKRIEELECGVKWLQFQIDKLQERQFTSTPIYYYRLPEPYPSWTVTCSDGTKLNETRL